MMPGRLYRIIQNKQHVPIRYAGKLVFVLEMLPNLSRTEVRFLVLSGQVRKGLIIFFNPEYYFEPVK
jgi:hypothetical protein